VSALGDITFAFLCSVSEPEPFPSAPIEVLERSIAIVADPNIGFEPHSGQNIATVNCNECRARGAATGMIPERADGVGAIQPSCYTLERNHLRAIRNDLEVGTGERKWRATRMTS
jgi:hypothetical protein